MNGEKWTRRIPGASDAAPIPHLRFDATRGAFDGFEIVRLAAFRERLRAHPDRLHRVAFHTLTVIETGTSHRSVDFVAYDCFPGTMIWTRPGQVQRFDAADRSDGWQVLFTADFLDGVPLVAELLDDWAPTICRHSAPGAAEDEIHDLCRLLTAAQARGQHPRGSDAVRLLLAALLIAIDSGSPERPSSTGSLATYTRFRRLLETRYAHDRSAASYAHALGYSARTLSRACQDAVGRTAKQIIDERVTLEARRLLAHDERPVSAIARALGFDEVTNFAKFFLRHTGATPAAFRRGGGADHGPHA